MRLLDKILFYKVALWQVRYLSPLDYGKAEGLNLASIEQQERDFVVGPPITVHMVNPDLMAGVWSMARECLAAGQHQRALGDVVAAAVSKLNTCSYCFDIHSSMQHSFGLPESGEVVAATEWAAATLTPGSEVLAKPPFPAADIPQLFGAATAFHYLNRMVNVFMDRSPFLIGGSGWMKDTAIRVAGNMLRPRLKNQVVAPGEFLNDAPDATLPPEFAWAAANPHIAGGFLRFTSAVEQAGIESVDPRVRQCVVARVQAWQGEQPGLGRQWVEEAIAVLEEDLRPAARLALVTALASWQVDEKLVADFRLHQPADRDLVQLTSWASYTAMRRIASWLPKIC